MSKRNRGLTLIDLAIVVLVVAVLAVVVAPQFVSSAPDDRKREAEIQLSTVRSLLQAYRVDHQHAWPLVDGGPSLEDALAGKTTAGGVVDAAGRCQPYLEVFPQNPYSGSARVRIIDHARPTVDDVTPGNAGGWLYHPATGGFWLDRSPGVGW